MQRFSYGNKDTGSQPQRQGHSLLTHTLFVAALAPLTAARLLRSSFRFSSPPQPKRPEYSGLL